MVTLYKHLDTITKNITRSKQTVLERLINVYLRWKVFSIGYNIFK